MRLKKEGFGTSSSDDDANDSISDDDQCSIESLRKLLKLKLKSLGITHQIKNPLKN